MSVGARVVEALAGSKARRVVVPGLDGAARAHLAASLIAQGKLPVLVGRDADDAEALYRDLAFFLGTSDDAASAHGLVFFGADEKSPYEAHSPDPRAVMERIATLYRLSRERNELRAVIVTPGAFARRHVPPELFDRALEYLVAGEPLERDRLLESLVRWGYNSVNVVEDPGTFSVRGGIIDVWSPYHPMPVRIDLFGDEIESLRLFEPTTQRAKQELDDAIILPAREIVFSAAAIEHAREAVSRIGDEQLIPSRKVRATIEDVDNQIHFFGIETLLPLFHGEALVTAERYLPGGDDVVYVLGERDALDDHWDQSFASAEAGWAQAQIAHELALPAEQHMAEGGAVLDAVLGRAAAVELPEIHVSGRADQAPVLELRVDRTAEIRAEIIKATRAADEGADLLGPVVRRLRTWRTLGHTTLLVCQTRGQAERLRSLLAPKGVQVRMRTGAVDFDELFHPGRTDTKLHDPTVHAWVVIGELSAGFSFPAAKLSVITEEELFGQRTKRRRTRKPAAGAFVSDLAELKSGDYVVHIDHGIGRYLGMTRLPVNGVDQDFLHIEYKGGDKLYLPVHRLRLVQKYASATEDRTPQLGKLGSTSWGATKKKVKDTLLKMAAELLRLYAMREAIEGYALPPLNEAYTRFEAEFPFEPTPDQVKAFEDCAKDLQSGRPMDRLICGDVGYGKTEVAMRAAMMVVQAKKQVAVLVPTTVLAAQHFHVFSERFSQHPVKIGVVSRFQSNEDVKRTLKEAKSGSLDILIGTHRILSKDVEFADLGMLVIDEEQRFGVAHKERLKKYRAKVHVLTMSATPIPRTLHMGMMGVRDMSLIATPPVDRLAVKVDVHKFNEEVIREAVLAEIRRGGQCFVVHNRVATIGAFGRMLERLVPEARVIIGHGQMDEDQLESVMVRFMNKEFNVLLSTTIIESGIDIPSANTIIVNRADRMGLAQLYQLRGRVGRSRVRGFAHFLIPASNLSKDARKRIAVLQRFTELGGGFKVASHDLEIRGAGNLLGQQQSGTINSVGFEMYQALLKEAIEDLRGAARQHLREPEMNLPVPALLPDKYIPEPGERLSYYQRFNRAETDEATYDLLQEITDLYGNPPAEVENLSALMLIKQRLTRLGALALDYGATSKAMPARFVVRFDAENPGVRPAQLVRYVERGARSRKLLPDGRLMVYLAPFDDVRDILGQIREQLDQLQLARLDKDG